MAELLTVPEIQNHKIVNSREWTTARKELLRKEKELTHLRDELAGSAATCRGKKLRRSMPSREGTAKKRFPTSFRAAAS